VRVDGHQPTLPRCDSTSGPRGHDDPSCRVPSFDVPTVARLSVTPVKSLQLLHPVEVRLEPQGIPGNRLFFLVDGQRRLFGDAQHGPLVRVVPSYAAET